MEALVRHESGHKDIAVALATEIERTLQVMAPHATCQQLESDANHAGHAILEKAGRLHKEYDRRTRHGKNNGAVFP